MQSTLIAVSVTSILVALAGMYINSRSLRLLSPEDRAHALRLPLSLRRWPWLFIPGPLLGVFLPPTLSIPLALALIPLVLFLLGRSLQPYSFPSPFRRRLVAGWSLQCLAYLVGAAYFAHMVWLIRESSLGVS